MKSMKSLLFVLFTLTLISLSVHSITAQEYPSTYEMWDSDEAFLFGFGLTICLMIIAIPLIIAILLCIWIYKDAERRSNSGALWVVLLILATIFFNIIGLIVILVIWLAVRPPEKSGTIPPPLTERRCPGCGRIIPDDARICPYCGKKFES